MYVEVIFGILIGGIVGLLINIMCVLYRIEKHLKVIVESEQKLNDISSCGETLKPPHYTTQKGD